MIDDESVSIDFLKSIKKSNVFDITEFTKRHLISKSDFGEIYKAENKFSHADFSVKVFYDGLDQYSKDFIRKLADITSNLPNFADSIHPALIKLFGFSFVDFDEEAHLTLCMEYFPNGSLENILYSPNLLNETQKLINIYGIASAMSYLHSLNILHKNLKPKNIFEDENFFPKVTNFVFYLNDQNRIENSETPIYTAPEIWKGEEYTKSSDVYSFSMIIYEILTNKKPFEKMSPFQVLTSVVQGQRPEIPSGIPQIYRELIERC